MALTDKQQRFVAEYLVDQNATQAAIRAGYSKKTAGQVGFENLKKPEIAEAIAKRQAKVAKKVEVTVESLAAELEEARAIALEEKQSSAAVSATMGKAKLFGLGLERRHLSGQVTFLNVTPEQLRNLTDDELSALERAFPVLQKLGVVAPGDPSGEAEPGSEQED